MKSNCRIRTHLSRLQQNSTQRYFFSPNPSEMFQLLKETPNRRSSSATTKAEPVSVKWVFNAPYDRVQTAGFHQLAHAN